MAARKNKSSHLPQGMIVHEKKSDGSLPDYIIQITPAEKAQFYEEFFQFFMTKIRTDDPPRYTMIAEMVRELERLPGMGMVLYMFKRVAPTFCDKGPINLLRQALVQVRHEDHLDMLCVFMQIAAFRWALIEKSFKNCARSREGRRGNSWIESDEGHLLAETFEEMRRNEIDFHEGYENKIVPILVEKEEMLVPIIRKIVANQKMHKHKGDWQGIKKTADRVQNTYNSDSVNYDEIKKLVLQLEPLERQFRDKYRRFCKNRREYRLIFFSSIRQFFSLEEMKETLWKELPSWPIEDCLKKYYNNLNDVIEIVLREANRLAGS